LDCKSKIIAAIIIPIQSSLGMLKIFSILLLLFTLLKEICIKT
jgi:hypothetical protein